MNRKITIILGGGLLALVLITGIMTYYNMPEKKLTRELNNAFNAVYKEQNYEKAIEICTQLMKNNPSPDVYNCLLMAYVRRGDSAEGLNYFSSLLNKQADDIFALKAIAKILSISGLINENYYHEKDAKDTLSYLDDVEKAITVWEELIKLSPNDPEPYREVVPFYYQFGYYDEAIKLSLKALELDKTDPVTWANLAALYIKKGDFLNAKEAAFNAISFPPRDPTLKIFPEAWGHLGNANLYAYFDFKEVSYLKDAYDAYATLLKMEKITAPAYIKSASEGITEVKNLLSTEGIDYEYIPQEEYKSEQIERTHLNSAYQSQIIIAPALPLDIKDKFF